MTVITVPTALGCWWRVRWRVPGHALNDFAEEWFRDLGDAHRRAREVAREGAGGEARIDRANIADAQWTLIGTAESRLQLTLEIDEAAGHYVTPQFTYTVGPVHGLT